MPREGKTRGRRQSTRAGVTDAEATGQVTAKSGKEVRSRRDKVRKPLDKHLEPKQKHMSREAYDEEIERLLDADDYVGAAQLKATYETPRPKAKK